MQTTIFDGPLFYILAFGAFLLISVLIGKFNQKIVDRNVAKAKAQDMMPALAKKLGITYKDLSTHRDTKDNIMDVGGKITGEYREIPMEIVMHGRADQANVPIGYKYAYTYSSERYIKFKVKNKDKKHFHIFMKDEGAVTKPSGKKEFDDEGLALTGNVKIPGKYLDEFAKMGWMDLRLEEDTLILNDTFYDQFQSALKAMKMLTVTHPVWGTSVKNPQMVVEDVVDFIDLLVDLIEEIGVK